MKLRAVAIVPAAGRGKRLGARVKKPFVLLKGLPLVSYALKALNSSKYIDAIIIASERSCVDSFKSLVRQFKLKKVIHIVVGGKTRYDSVRNCLNKMPPSFDIVLIHDGARPFLQRSAIKDSIRLAEIAGACIVAVPETDTVKLVDKGLVIKKTLDRTRIFRAQTPQAFRRELIKKAYGRSGRREITDDASMVEMLGKPVKIIKGSYRNIKVTTKEDLKLAEVLL